MCERCAVDVSGRASEPYRALGFGEKPVFGNCFVAALTVHREWNFRAFFFRYRGIGKERRNLLAVFVSSIEPDGIRRSISPNSMGPIQQGYVS